MVSSPSSVPGWIGPEASITGLLATDSGFASYLANGVGLLPGLEPLALGSSLMPGVISEQQLAQWSTGLEGSGALITGLEEKGVGVLDLLGGGSCDIGCPCPPPSKPLPCDDPTKTTPEDCPCSAGGCQRCCATGFFDYKAPSGLNDVRFICGLGTLFQWTNNSAAVSSGLPAGNGWSLSGVPKLILRQSDYLGPRSIALPFHGTDVRTFERSTTDCNLFIRSVKIGRAHV